MTHSVSWIGVCVELSLGESWKKRTFYGQADRKRWPPPPCSPIFVILLCSFDLILWFSVVWNWFYTRKGQFSSKNWNPQSLLYCCCPLDDHLQEAGPHFECQRIKFQWKKKITHLLMARAEGAEPTALTVSLTVKCPFLTTPLALFEWCFFSFWLMDSL